MPNPWDNDEVLGLAKAPWEGDEVLFSPTESEQYSGPERRSRPRAASGFVEAMIAGYQGSATGLMARGKLPDIVLDPEHAPWYEKLASGVAQVVSELPEMTAGAFVGGAAGVGAGSAVPIVGSAIGGLVGAGAGTFALPTLIRESLMQAYEARDVQSSGEFLHRTGIVIKETAKSALVGGLTFGAGKAAQVATKTFGRGAMTVADIAAQTGTMTVTPALLEGHLPEPVDFMNAAIMVAGGKAAHATATKLREIYKRTGIRPEQVVKDAAKDAELAAEIRNEIPEGFKPIPAKYEGPQMGLEGEVAFQLYTIKKDIPGHPKGSTVSDITLKQLKYHPLDPTKIPDGYKAVEQIVMGRDIVPGEKTSEIVAGMLTEKDPFPIPEQVGRIPGHQVNLRYINGGEDVKIALSRISEVAKDDINVQRRNVVTWGKTLRDSNNLLRAAAEGKDPTLFLKRKPGTAANDNEIVTRGRLMMAAAKDSAVKGREYEAKVEKGEATGNDLAELLSSVERAKLIQAEFLGARAEIGRAQNALKLLKDATYRAKAIEEILNRYQADPITLAKMLKELDTPEGVLKFTKEIGKATTWEKLVEAWKAGLVSGPITHMANIIGNTTFYAVRVPIDVMAGAIRGVRGGKGAVMAESMASITAVLEGGMEAMRAMGSALKSESFRTNSKGEIIRPAIEGKLGVAIRYPFRVLQAEDAFFKTLNRAAETHRLAFRTAINKGLDPRSLEFREEVARLRQHPPEELAKEIFESGDRFTFNLPLGEKGRAVQNLVRTWHLEWAVPFVRTPGNIAKELGRMSPIAPFIKEWRLDIQNGGARADKALAEIAVGTTVMGVVSGLALNGNITGAGEPDLSKKRIDIAAGKQPYSVKLGDTWYSYGRLQPVGTLMGLAADMAEVWDHMNDVERDKIPKMLGIAFANAVTNQTFLQGITNIVNAMTDFQRYGSHGIYTLAGSLIPGLISQTAQAIDPLNREIDGALDAIKYRIPLLRQTLFPKRDPFGQPIPGKDLLFGITPISKMKPSEDPVRTEASRLGVGVAKSPSYTELPAAGERRLGRVELTTEQQDIFSQTSGELAYEILDPLVNSPTWPVLPDLVQRRIYEAVFTRARKVGMVKAFPPDKRREEADRITQEIMKRLVEKNR